MNLSDDDRELLNAAAQSQRGDITHVGTFGGRSDWCRRQGSLLKRITRGLKLGGFTRFRSSKIRA